MDDPTFSRPLLIDPNTVAEADLRALPGVGPALAARIVAARPFTGLEDMARVKGLRAASLQKFAGYLTFPSAQPPPASLVELLEELPLPEEPPTPGISAAPEEPPTPVVFAAPEEPPTPGISAAPEEPPTPVVFAAPEDSPAPAEPQPEPDDLLPPPAPAEMPAPPPPLAPESAPPKISRTPAPAPKPVSRGQAAWMVFAGSLFAFVFAVVFTLSLLTALNRGLRYPSAREAAALAVEIRALQTQAAALDQSLTGLRTRMDNLESLSGRVTTLATGLEALSTDVSAFQAEVDSLGAQIETLQGQTSRYQQFLDGLYSFLLEFVSPEASP